MLNPPNSSNDQALKMKVVADFLFTIIDKNQSNELELSNFTDFASKIICILAKIANTTVKIFGNALSMAMAGATADAVIEQHDQDGDGKLTLAELTMGYHLGLLAHVKQMGVVAPL